MPAWRSFDTARRDGNAEWLERFRREWIVAVAPPKEGTLGTLPAVNESHRIVGADRAARTSLLLDVGTLRVGVSLWAVFERDIELFRRKDGTYIPTRLIDDELSGVHGDESTARGYGSLTREEGPGNGRDRGD